MESGSQGKQWTPVQGAATTAAVSHRPTEDTGDAASEDLLPGYVSHGLPISLEDYERLKARARFEKPLQSSIGHQDTALTSDPEA